VLVFNRMSKRLKAVTKKLFGRKSNMGPEGTLFRGSTLGSSRRDEILKHIDPTLVGRMICYQRSEVTLIFSYHFAGLGECWAGGELRGCGVGGLRGCVWGGGGRRMRTQMVWR
jgi:hypothetical protein